MSSTAYFILLLFCFTFHTIFIFTLFCLFLICCFLPCFALSHPWFNFCFYFTMLLCFLQSNGFPLARNTPEPSVNLTLGYSSHGHWWLQICLTDIQNLPHSVPSGLPVTMSYLQIFTLASRPSADQSHWWLRFISWKVIESIIVRSIGCTMLIQFHSTI